MVVRQVLLTGGAVAAMVVLGPGDAAGATLGPETDTPWVERASAESSLSLSVEGGKDKVVTGTETTYVITAENSGEEPVPVILRASVPLRMSEVIPHDGGALGDGFVDWPVTLAPGAPMTVRLTGVYDEPDPDRTGGRAVRAAFTACAMDPEEGQPIICATDIAHLTAPSPAWWWWLGGAALVAVTAGGVAATWGRRRRPRRRHRHSKGRPAGPEPAASGSRLPT